MQINESTYQQVSLVALVIRSHNLKISRFIPASFEAYNQNGHFERVLRLLPRLESCSDFSLHTFAAGILASIPIAGKPDSESVTSFGHLQDEHGLHLGEQNE